MRPGLLAPRDADLVGNLGVTLAIGGDRPGAIFAFESGLKSGPENQAARENLARAGPGEKAAP